MLSWGMTVLERKKLECKSFLSYVFKDISFPPVCEEKKIKIKTFSSIISPPSTQILFCFSLASAHPSIHSFGRYTSFPIFTPLSAHRHPTFSPSASPFGNHSSVPPHRGTYALPCRAAPRSSQVFQVLATQKHLWEISYMYRTPAQRGTQRMSYLARSPFSEVSPREVECYAQHQLCPKN